jgi:hypothetical protein
VEPNYKLEFSVADAARVLNVAKDLIKKWSFLFSAYLSQSANPLKGTPRQFSSKDLQVFSYVLMNWEDTPDLEAIKTGLNCKEHFDEPFNQFISAFTPIFIDPPEDLNEDWRHGALYSSGFTDLFELANSYKIAGDTLVETALSKDYAFALLYPVIYNYRHATELYLKAVLNKNLKSHVLNDFIPDFKELLITNFNTELPEWFENIFLVFNDFDSTGTTFRYGGDLNYIEKWVDFNHLKEMIGLMAESFSKIKSNIHKI